MSLRNDPRTLSRTRRSTLPILAVVSALVVGAFAQAAIARAENGGRTQVPGPTPLPTPSPVPIPTPAPMPTPYDAGY